MTAAAAVAGMLALSAVALVEAQQRVLTRGIDEALIQRADNIERDVLHGTFGTRLPVEGDPEDSFLQLVDAAGSVVAQSDNVAGLPAATEPLEPDADEVNLTVTGVLDDDAEFRVHARALPNVAGRRSTPELTLVAGKNLDDVNESVSILVVSLVVSIPVVTTLLAFLVWWLTGRILRPVESIRREVATIQAHELHRRVSVPTSEDEIARLAGTMNKMLDRLQEAADRQRRFVADASHELRSPLTRLRSTLEVSRAHPDTLDLSELAEELLADTIDLQKLVDDLLFLARSEERAVETARTPVDLDDLVLAEARRMRGRGTARVDVTGVSAARTLGNADELARVVSNLSSNAERHARDRVSFELYERNGVSELVVSDDGPGIAPEHREVVFQRFTRLDEARSRDAGGAGLGLAIVHEIVTRHQGSVEICDRGGSGARFVVRLPRAE